MSLNSLLTRLIWTCVLPIVILASYLAYDRVTSLQLQRDQESANMVHNFATSIDQLIFAQTAALQVLAASPLLDNPAKLSIFYRQALGFHQNLNNHIILADPSSQMLLNTRLPYGASLPVLPKVKGHSSVSTALATGEPAIGDMFLGPIAMEPLVTITVPIFKDGQLRFFLLSLIDARQFQKRLDAFVIPPGCSVTVYDGKGDVIASRSTANLINRPISADPSKKIEVKSTISPWSVVLDTSGYNYSSAINTVAATMAAAIAGATLISVLGGMLASRKLANAVESLANPAAPPIKLPKIAEIETVRTILHNAAKSREEAESTLISSEERYRSLVETAPIAIFINRANVIEFANPAAIRLFGAVYAKDILNRSPYEFFDQKFHDSMHNRINLLLHGGRVPLVETKILQINGTERYVEVNAVAFTDQKGTAIQVMMHDITERKQAEEENTKLEAKLLQAQKMESVGRLAGGVAHDFNNMLSVILGYANLGLAELDPSQELHSNLEEIRKAAERSADLTRQLLAFARKQTIVPKVLDLNEIVSSMLKMLQRLIGEDIHLTWQPATSLWLVNMDPSQIDQILANLCVNSRDAIKDIGKITIETRNSTFDKDYCDVNPGFIPGNYVLLAVSDDGCGIDKETLAHIFEPFFTTKAINEGTGLGLATVFGIVKQNNGFINVYSELSHGTTFKIYIPKHEGSAELTLTSNSAIPLSRGQETILLVEDEPSILKMTTIFLEKHGYTVLPVGTPSEAISMASKYKRKIHLLMTDVVMPEMNGRDLAIKLRSICPEIRSLFTSGYTANVIAHHGVLDKGVNFIPKPFSIQDLTAKVREALDDRTT